MVDRKNMPVEDFVRSQLQSEEDLTDQRSSHFKPCIIEKFHNSNHCKKSAASFDLPIGTVMTKLKLFHVVEKNVPC